MIDWKAEYAKMHARKTHWKLRYYVALTVAVLLAISTATLGAIIGLQKSPPATETLHPVFLEPPPTVQRVGAEEPAAPTPPHVLASVIICNSGPSCSATIVSRGESWSLGVSAAHCYQGRIGGKFWIYFPDGTRDVAQLLAHDRSRDLALFRLPAASVLGVAPIPEKMLDQVTSYEVCGYPQAVGPTWHRIRTHGRNNLGVAEGMHRWTFDVDGDGRIQPVNSGCGVFADGMLVGVLSHRELTGEAGKTLYCSPHAHLVAFVEECRKKNNLPRRDYGNIFCTPDGCEPAPAPPARPDEKPAEAPPADWQKGAPSPPAFTPRPNVPIRKPAPYSGKGRRPGDLDSDCDMAREIDKLRQSQPNVEALAVQITELVALIKAQQGQTPPGTPGTPADAHSEKILERLAGLEKLIAGLELEGAPGVDIDALKLALSQTVKVETGKLAEGLGGAVGGLKSDVVAAVESKLGNLGAAAASATATAAGAAAPSLWATIGIPALAAGAPVGILGGVGLWMFGRMLKRIAPPGATGGGGGGGAGGGSPGPTVVRVEGKPFPVTMDSPAPPQQVIPERFYQAVEKNSFAEAYDYARSQYVRKYPTAGEGTVALMDSLISQYLSGKGVKHGSGV